MDYPFLENFWRIRMICGDLWWFIVIYPHICGDTYKLDGIIIQVPYSRGNYG